MSKHESPSIFKRFFGRWRSALALLSGNIWISACGAPTVQVTPPGGLVIARYVETVPFGNSGLTAIEVKEVPEDGRVTLTAPSSQVSINLHISSPGHVSVNLSPLEADATVSLGEVSDPREERRQIADLREIIDSLAAQCASGEVDTSACERAKTHLEARAERMRKDAPQKVDAGPIAPIPQPYGAIVIDSWDDFRQGQSLLESGVELEDGAIALLEVSTKDRNLDVAHRSVVVLGTDHRVRFVADLEGTGEAAIASWGAGAGLVGVTLTTMTRWDGQGKKLASIPLDPPLESFELVKDAIAIGTWKDGEGDLLVAVHNVHEGRNGPDALAKPLRLERYDARGKKMSSRPVPEVLRLSSISVGPQGTWFLHGEHDHGLRNPPVFPLPKVEGRELVAVSAGYRAVFETTADPGSPVKLLGTGLHAFTANDVSLFPLVLEAQPKGEVSPEQAIKRSFLLRLTAAGKVEAVADRTDPGLRRESYRFIRPHPQSRRLLLVSRRDVHDRGASVIELTPP
jgi:hypothetical protein